MEESKIVDIVTDLSVEYSDLIINSFLKDGLLKDIPIIGTGINILKISTNISDLFLLRKIKLFMNSLNIIAQSDIDKFKEKLSNDNFREKVCIKLISIIDKLDEDIKIEWIAKIYLEYLDKKIDKNFFFRIITIINNTFVNDILELRKLEVNSEILSNNKKVKTYVLQQLFSNGLLDNYGFDGGTADVNGDCGIIYNLNEYGDFIYKKILLYK